MKLPRLLIAAPSSGQGKTMLTISLMAALAQRGLKVAPNKVGPDYIDPGYHYLATGRISRNLDAVMCGEKLIGPLLAHGALCPEPADIALIEGVMGLFDGRLGKHGFASAAHIAKLTATPVLLCVDASHTSRTAAATVLGIANYDPELKIAGVIFNKVSSPTHQAEIREAMEKVPVPVLGFIPKHADAQAPSRHLGLVPIEERPEAGAQLAGFSALIKDCLDLDRLIELANQAPDLPAEPWNPAAVVQAPTSQRPVVAMAGGRAFTFRYAETAELLRAGGCEVIEFDPTRDAKLPDQVSGIYLGGGFPQVHAGEISANQQLLAQVREAVHAGVPTVAECAGLLYLTRTLDGAEMTGCFELSAEMEPKLKMGYRLATAPADTLLAKAGEQVWGHEFHRTAVAGADDYAPAWQFDIGRADGISVDPAGKGRPSVHASYLHLHWAGNPALAQRFINAVHEFTQEAKHGI